MLNFKTAGEYTGWW